MLKCLVSKKEQRDAIIIRFHQVIGMYSHELCVHSHLDFDLCLIFHTQMFRQKSARQEQHSAIANVTMTTAAGKSKTYKGHTHGKWGVWLPSTGNYDTTSSGNNASSGYFFLSLAVTLVIFT